MPSSRAQAATPFLSLAVRAGHASTSTAMMQGLTCHARGVELVVSTGAHVHARVRSKRTHDVHLRADGERLLVACSCAASTFGAPVCQHVWAALLEVDRRSGLESLRAKRGALSVESAVQKEPAKTKTKPKMKKRP
jgi:hypothetical protein